MSKQGQMVLTVNCGSSSLKVALYEMGAAENLLFTATVERIGQTKGQIQITGPNRKPTQSQIKVRNQHEAFDAAMQFLQQSIPSAPISAVSHRIVHGGRHYQQPQRITASVLKELRELIPLDPDHLPQAISGVEAASRKFPKLPQIACFDTAFHRQMPRVAQLCALPMKYFNQGILNYGFHGISYEYIVSELRKLEGDLAKGRVIIAHLGNGASMAAVKNGRSVDTSMGFTPLAGLVMGTRCGDLDPGVILHLLTRKSTTVKDLNTLLNKQSGLLGVSGTSSDMQDLLAQERRNSHAADAVALFCYRAKKYLAAYTAVLGGLDIVVFTGGIGEHAAAIRERSCAGMDAFGIRLNAAQNRANSAVISSTDSRVKVRVIKTNENLMLARHAAKVLSRTSKSRGQHHGHQSNKASQTKRAR